jgi:hypothetical protein
VSGFGLVAGVVALFFACGILTGVLGVMALSAIRDHRGRAERPDQIGELPPSWPSGRRDLTGPGD